MQPNHEHEEQRAAGIIAFRAPASIAEAVEKAAAKELISVSAYARRALLRSLQSDGVMH